MWYLSSENNLAAKKLSHELLNQNGWEDQFSVTKKVLHQYSAAVDFFNSENLNFKHKYELMRHIVDVLVVNWHIYNKFSNDAVDEFNFDPFDSNAFMDIAIDGYTVGGEQKEGKLPRTYRKVLGRDYVKPANPFNLQKELDLARSLVLTKKIQDYGINGALKFQNSIASEEAGELTKELSKYYRTIITNDEDAAKLSITCIRDEMYDTLYCMPYVFTAAEINLNELNMHAAIRIPEIYAREITYKRRGR